jgi:hypothetical protein
MINFFMGDTIIGLSWKHRVDSHHPEANVLCLMSAMSAISGVVDFVYVFATFGASNDESVALLVSFYVAGRAFKFIEDANYKYPLLRRY